MEEQYKITEEVNPTNIMKQRRNAFIQSLQPEKVLKENEKPKLAWSKQENQAIRKDADFGDSYRTTGYREFVAKIRGEK